MDPVSKAQLAQSSESPRERRLRNLKPYPKGVSGNPGGRPKKKPLTEIYEKIFRKAKNRKEVEAALLKVLLGGRMSTVLLAREMAERLEGKVVQELDLNVDATVQYADAVARIRSRKAKNEPTGTD